MIYSCAYLWLIVQKRPFFGSAILVDYFWWHQYRPWTPTVAPQKLKNLEVKDLSEEKKHLTKKTFMVGTFSIRLSGWLTSNVEQELRTFHTHHHDTEEDGQDVKDDDEDEDDKMKLEAKIIQNSVFKISSLLLVLIMRTRAQYDVCPAFKIQQWQCNSGR